MADLNWEDYAAIAGAVAPALTGGSQYRSPFDDPNVREAQRIQTQRMQQSQPAYDTLVQMAYGMSPTRYRGNAPAFGGAPAGGGQQTLSGAAGRPMAPGAPSQQQQESGGSNVWQRLAGPAAMIPKLFGGGDDGPQATPLKAGSSVSGAAYPLSPPPSMDWTEYDRKAADSLRAPDPSVTTAMGPIMAQGGMIVVGPDGREVIAYPMGGEYFFDEQGNAYDQSGKYVGSSGGSR